MSRAGKQWQPGRMTAVQTRKRPRPYDFERAMEALHAIHEAAAQASRISPGAPRGNSLEIEPLQGEMQCR